MMTSMVELINRYSTLAFTSSAAFTLIDPSPPVLLRGKAILRLWEAVASRIRVRHPDPKVTVRLSVRISMIDDLIVSFEMNDMRDTGNPDQSFSGFVHRAKIPLQWPGDRAAEAYVAALWSLYMIHESLELTTYRTRAWDAEVQTFHLCECGCGQPSVVRRESPVVDAHDAGGHHQKTLANGVSDLAGTIDWVLGLGTGATIISDDAELARRQVENEIDPWTPGT